MRRAITASLAAAVMLISGCTKDADTTVIQVKWQQVNLPIPPGPGNRIMLRESVTCAGKTYVLGGIGNPEASTAAGDIDNGFETRPAVWVSDDLTAWKPVTLNPKDYYGERSVLYSAACRDGKIAVIGSKTGGAHGNPRVSTWYQQEDGSLIQVVAHFELYNGPNFMNVARMVSGPKGWLIAGNRTGGAAVWLSPDAHKFDIVEDAPNLANNDQGITWGADAVATPDGWMVVGGYLPKGRIDRDPATWTSPDGLSWTRNLLAGTGKYEELQRVTGSGGDYWATGLSGTTFGAWHYTNGKWEQTGTFATLGGASAPQVKSLIPLQKGLATAGVTGEKHEIWASPDGRSWRQAELPAPAPAGAERTISINAIDQRILLVIDDGQLGKAWFGTLSVTF